MYSKQCKCINVQCTVHKCTGCTVYKCTGFTVYKCTGCTECTPWDWQAAKEPLTFDQLEQRFRNNNKLINIIFIFKKMQTCALKIRHSESPNQSKKSYFQKKT